MAMDRDRFERSLTADEPPSGLSPALRALWHGLRGEWSVAHGIVQDHEDDPSCRWVHAWLHRIEGDLANARYWYGRAGRPPGSGPTEAEGRAIAEALLRAGKS